MIMIKEMMQKGNNGSDLSKKKIQDSQDLHKY